MPPVRNVVAIDGHLQCRPYRLHYRWDGGVRLVALDEPAGAPYLAVVDASLPYWRLIGSEPTQRRTRETLLMAAPESFPFPQESTRYAIGEGESGACFYALPESELQRLPVSDTDMDTLLVAKNAADPDSVVAAIEHWFAHGRSADLGPRPWTPRSVFTAVLGLGLLAALCALAALILDSSFVERGLREQLLSSEKDTRRLSQQYQAIRKMADTNMQLLELRKQSGSGISTLLAKLWATLPPGHSIRKIEFKDNILHMEGNGGNAKPWLLQQGFAENKIVLVDLPTIKQFSADMALPVGAVPPP